MLVSSRLLKGLTCRFGTFRDPGRGLAPEVNVGLDFRLGHFALHAGENDIEATPLGYTSSRMLSPLDAKACIVRRLRS